MLVLSAAVLVIVIDARDAAPWGWRAEVGHGMTRKITERRWGRARAQRSGARNRNRRARSGAVGRARGSGPRNDTDDHGKGRARMARGGWTTKDTKHTKGEMAKPPIGKALA